MIITVNLDCKLKEHGEIRVELDRDIVHAYPKGDFNEYGIMSLHAKIREIAPKNRKWCLIEHPKGGAGLTPEAAEELMNSYCNLSSIGCVAVGLEINKIWAKVIHVYINGKVDIPVYFSESAQEVETLTSNHLDRDPL